MDEIIGWKANLEEVKYAYQRQNSSLEGLKATARSIFQGSSLILALIGALQIWSEKGLAAASPLKEVILVMVLLCYFCLIVLCIVSMFPSDWLGPIDTNWDTLFKTLVAKESEVEMIQQQISNYLNVIKLNDQIIFKTGKLIKWQGGLLGGIVLLLLILSVLPR